MGLIPQSQSASVSRRVILITNNKTNKESNVPSLEIIKKNRKQIKILDYIQVKQKLNQNEMKNTSSRYRNRARGG